jgi:hypothetical protein
MTPDIVKLTTLRELIAAGSIRAATVLGQRGGWAVLVRYGMHEKALAARTGEPRLFRTVDSAVKVLRGAGLGRVELDSTGYDPVDFAASRRPDRAVALRQAHAAAAYNNWLAGEIQAAIDDPRPDVSHDDVMAEMDADIAALEVAHARKKKRA